MKTILLIAALLLAPSSSWAFDARDTADITEPNSYSVGIFNPFRLNLNERIALEAHPIFFFLAPHMELHYAHLKQANGWRVSSIWGLSVPSPAINTPFPLGLQGYFLPTCKVAKHDPKLEKWCQKPGILAVPKAGVIASRGVHHIWTLQVDFTMGLLLSGERPAPLDTYPMLDLLLAPIANRWRAHGSVRYDHQFVDWLRVSTEAHLYRVGENKDYERSPWTLSAHVGADIALSETLRLTLGIYYWNSDQKRVELVENNQGITQLHAIRSNDILPTIDLIWNGSF